MTKKTNLPFVFLGTPDIAVTMLEELKNARLVPTLIVTAPDKPVGRGMQLTAPPVKVWADKQEIPTLQPTLLDNSFCNDLNPTHYNCDHWDVFVLTAYGKILSRDILEIPDKGIVNMHPSLLPKYRGPSPIQSQILANDSAVGVSIMLLDEEMDHGPIIAQKKITTPQWPMRASDLTQLLAHEGGTLLAQTLPDYVAGNIEPTIQNHSEATLTHMIDKQDAEIDLIDNPYQNYLKFCAYDIWPRTFFFTNSGKRVIITDAHYEDGEFVIERVIPEGKEEMRYEKFKTLNH